MTVKYVDATQEQVAATEETIYTAPISTDFESAQVIYSGCVNASADDAELTINIVQSGGTASAANRYFPPSKIFAGESDALSSIVGRVLKAGDFIVSIAGTASALNLSIGIKEIYTD